MNVFADPAPDSPFAVVDGVGVHHKRAGHGPVALLPHGSLIAYRWLGLNAIAAFWFAYVITRPLGASFSDWFALAPSKSGLGMGYRPGHGRPDRRDTRPWRGGCLRGLGSVGPFAIGGGSGCCGTRR